MPTNLFPTRGQNGDCTVSNGWDSSFFDTTLVFGSKCAPANFDCLAETLVNIVCTEENLNKGMVHRKLDDVPVVSARETKFAERFSAKYEVCKNCRVPLAETCPDHEKVFGPST